MASKLIDIILLGKDNEMWKLEDLMVSGSSQQFHPTESEPLLATMEKVSTLFHR